VKKNRSKQSILALALFALLGTAAQVIGAGMSVTADAFLTASVGAVIAIGNAIARRSVLLALVAFAVGNMTTMLFIGHP